MKQIKILGVLAIALCLGLSSCGKGGEDVSGGDVSTSEQGSEEHVHTFETEWTSNGSKHWHKATCGHNVKGDEAEHTFGEPYDIVPATCTEDGSQKRKCTVCEYVKTEKLTKLGHDEPPAEGSDAWTPISSPDCTNPGKHSYHCSKCDQDIEVVIPALGHQYEQENGEDKVVWTQVADCTNAGIGTKTCLRCGAVENVSKDALGHDWGEWEVTLEATCTAAGSRKHKCARCNLEEAEEIAALGHDIHLVGNDGEPEAGKAKVRLYDCSRCDVTYLGFKATEVTAASHDRLVFEEYTSTDADGNEVKEQGARFFGHPIGNDVELDPTTGDANENSVAVYSKEQTGDFFEYVFDLDATQVATLSGDEGACLCYVDALPANWMQQNNMDFFAKGSETDWTKAYYIDDNPNHYQQATDDNGTPDDKTDDFPKVDEQGNPVMEAKEIEGWRYVLYVDGQYKDFDAEVATNKMVDNNRKEFVIPYLFKLHTGENRISLRMAAGYRCTFFNFTFRPYVAPTPITVNESTLTIREYGKASITSSMTGLKYSSSSSSIATVDANGVVTGVKAGKATITVTKDGNYKPAKVEVTVTEVQGVLTVQANKGVVAPEGGIEVYSSSYSGTRLRKFQKDSTLTFTFDAKYIGEHDIVFTARGANLDFAQHISVTVNGAAVTVSGSINSGSSNVTVNIGKATLQAKDNVLVITTLTTNNPLELINMVLVPGESATPAPTDHVHDFSSETKVDKKADGYVDYYTATCAADNAQRISIKAMDGTFAEGSANKTGNGAPLDGYMKLAGNNQSISYKFDWNGGAKTAKLYQYGYMDGISSNGSKNYTSKGSSGGLGPSGCNFGVVFNSNEVAISDETKATSFSEFFEDATVSQVEAATQILLHA